MNINGVQFNNEFKAGLEIISFEDEKGYSVTTISNLIELIYKNKIDLECIVENVKYQREYIENGKKIDASKLIQNVIDGKSIGTLDIGYWKNDDQWKMTNGQQRATTLKKIINNEIAINIEVDGNIITNKFYSELSEEIQDKILNATINFHIIKAKTEEDFSSQFINSNSGIPVNGTEKLRALLGKDAFKFDSLLEKDYMKNVLATISENRANKFDIVLKLAYILNQEYSGKEDEPSKYAINESKLKKFVLKLKEDSALFEFIISKAEMLLDYMALAFDHNEYYESDKIKRTSKSGKEIDTKYNFLGKSKSHSVALFVCAMMFDMKLSPEILYGFAKYMHLTIGKKILSLGKEDEENYKYLYWFNTSDSPTNGNMYLYLKKEFEVYLKDNGHWNKENKSVSIGS